MSNIAGNGVVRTVRELEMKVWDNGITTMPIDVLAFDQKEFHEVQFHISTSLVKTEMTQSALESLGYTISDGDSVVVSALRLGFYDFSAVEVTVSTQNTLGVDVLPYFNIHLHYMKNVFEVDLLDRLKVLVDKGINKRISSLANSSIKSSCHNKSAEWYSWNEIDRRFPNSWVLLWGGDDELDCGGEVLWHSETEIPETIQDNTFLYCNKSIATKTPGSFAHEDSIRCRNFIKPSEEYEAEIDRLESLLVSPTINRFYYDVVSCQGRFISLRKGKQQDAKVATLLTQKEIDELVAEFFANASQA